MRLPAQITVFVTTASFALSSLCIPDDSMKNWEVLKRDYAQTLSQTAKKAIERQIIDKLATVSSEELMQLSATQWFWNIIIADLLTSAREELTRALKTEALDILVTRLNDPTVREVEVARILSMIIENIAEDELIQKLRPFLKAAEISGQISEAIRKRLIPLRITQANQGQVKPEIDELLTDLAAADVARRALAPKPSDASWLLKLDPVDVKTLVKDKKFYDSVWTALRGAKPEIINKMKPELLEIIFEELIKEPGYKSVGAIVPGSHLEIAKTVIQKLDENAAEFANLYKAILSSVWSNVKPLSGSLSVKAKKIKDREESLRILGLIEKANAERLAAVKAGVEAQKIILEEYNRKADLEGPQAATGLFWLSSPANLLAPRNFNVEADLDFKDWLTSGYLTLKEHDKIKENLEKILKNYVAADDATRSLMRQAFVHVLNQEDLFDFIDALDDEPKIALFTQLLKGEKGGYTLMQKYWKHEARNAGLRGKSVEERALRRMALVLHYLSAGQLEESMQSDSFWGLLSTYPILAAVGLSKASLARLSKAIYEPEKKILRADLANILARIIIKLDENRPDVFASLLSMAQSANDIVIAEAIIKKFKALKPKIMKTSAQDANYAEQSLMDAIKSGQKI